MTRTSKVPSRTGEMFYFTYHRTENERINKTVLEVDGFRRNFSWNHSQLEHLWLYIMRDQSTNVYHKLHKVPIGFHETVLYVGVTVLHLQENEFEF